ncbi:hypothetical protein D3C73_1321510 [compost metagenome]
MHQNSAGHAPFADRVEAVFHRNIIIDLHIIDFDAVLAGQKRSILEVHHIAAVVLDD